MTLPCSGFFYLNKACALNCFTVCRDTVIMIAVLSSAQHVLNRHSLGLINARDISIKHCQFSNPFSSDRERIGTQVDSA